MWTLGTRSCEIPLERCYSCEVSCGSLRNQPKCSGRATSAASAEPSPYMTVTAIVSAVSFIIRHVHRWGSTWGSEDNVGGSILSSNLSMSSGDQTQVVSTHGKHLHSLAPLHTVPWLLPLECLCRYLHEIRLSYRAR